MGSSQTSVDEGTTVMKINCESWAHYLRWMVDGYHFSFAGFSDAEWYCMMGVRIGERTGLGQTINAAHGRVLLDVLKRRQYNKRFLFAIPKCLWQMPGFAEGQIDWFLGRKDISIEGYERDMVLDDAARDAELYPFIRQLQDMKTVMIGPDPLRCMGKLLGLKAFVEIPTPNLHMTQRGIFEAVTQTLDIGLMNCVYLISAGVSAASIIDQLHDKITNSWFIDCGSIWDAFAGIGGQREWRSILYGNKTKCDEWKHLNLEGKHGVNYEWYR